MPARLRLVGFALIAIYMILALVDLEVGHVTGDTTQLVAGVQLLEDCLRSTEWAPCRDVDTVAGGTVFPYASLQYLPALVMALIGLEAPEITRGLQALSLAAFGGTLALTYYAVRRRVGADLATVGVLGVFLSSALYQATAGFGEMLAAFMGVALAASCIARLPAPIFFAAALAVLMKDTALPFLIVIGLLAGRDSNDRWLPPRQVLLPLGVGATVGATANAAFNQFRMGTWSNSFYLQEKFRTPVELVPEWWVTQWLSPSGGLLWYWPITTLLLLATAASVIIGLRKCPRDVRRWLPQAVVVGLAAAWTLGLSFWWTPFGWTTVGPRLAVPLLPALTVLALTSGADHLREGARRAQVAAPAAVVAAASLALIFTPLPWDWYRALSALEAATGGCPPLYENLLGSKRYYECAQQTVRRGDLTLLAPRTTLPDARPGVAVGTLAVLLLSSSVTFGRSDRAQADSRQPAHGGCTPTPG